jgi:SAF domain
METDDRLLLLSPDDSVFVLRRALEAGEVFHVAGVAFAAPRRLGIGHKIARRAVPEGERVVKYGAPIGRASADIAVGDHVHLHNLVSEHTPTYALEAGSP